MGRRWFFDINYHRHDKAKRRSRRLVKLIVLLLVAGAVYVVVDYFYFTEKDSGPSESTTAVQSSYEIPTNVYKTKYFEIETSENWKYEKKASGPNKFVYHNVRNKLVRGFIYIYVNEDPVPHHKQATRLLPVTLGADGFLDPDFKVTAHCNKTAPNKDKVGEEIVTLKGITFMCDNDATWYSVLVGLKGSSPSMKLKRPDGSYATYTIFYQDSTANPTALDLIEVIERFKVL